MRQSATPPEAPERWLSIPGYEGIYEISDLSRVWSLSRTVFAGRGRYRVHSGHMMTPTIDESRYVINLSRDGRCCTRLVHRLVLEAFVGPCPDGLEALHGPGGALDNRLVNLRWGTKIENELDKLRDGTLLYGDRCENAILTAQIVAECRRRHASGETQAALAREFGVHRITMHDAIFGRTWRRVA